MMWTKMAPCINITRIFVFLQVKLLEIFSQFGLVYEVQVIDSSDSLEGDLFSCYSFLIF